MSQEPPSTVTLRFCPECGQHALSPPGDLLDAPGSISRLGRLHSRSHGPAFVACDGIVQECVYARQNASTTEGGS